MLDWTELARRLPPGTQSGTVLVLLERVVIVDTAVQDLAQAHGHLHLRVVRARNSLGVKRAHFSLALDRFISVHITAQRLELGYLRVPLISEVVRYRCDYGGVSRQIQAHALRSSVTADARRALD